MPLRKKPNADYVILDTVPSPQYDLFSQAVSYVVNTTVDAVRARLFVNISGKITFYFTSTWVTEFYPFRYSIRVNGIDVFSNLQTYTGASFNLTVNKGDVIEIFGRASLTNAPITITRLAIKSNVSLVPSTFGVIAP